MGNSTRVRKTRMGPMGLMRRRPISHMSPIGLIRVSARRVELPVAVLALGATSTSAAGCATGLAKACAASTFPPTALTPAGRRTDRPRNST